MTEAIRHLMPIKMFAYEPLFIDKIMSKRVVEAKWIRLSQIWNFFANSSEHALPAIAAVGESPYSLLPSEEQ